MDSAGFALDNAALSTLPTIRGDDVQITGIMKIHFGGRVLTVKARIRLVRSFDHIPTHLYQGYALVMKGEIGALHAPFVRTEQ